MRVFIKYILFLLLFCSELPVGADNREVFPVPQGLELRVQFWVNIYSHFTLDQRVIHDRDKPERIYSVINLRDLYPTGRISYKMAAAAYNKEKKRIAALLIELGRGTIQHENMTAELKRLSGLFGPKASPDDFKRAARRIHIQRGAKESFAQGIERSGKYIAAMKRIFRIQDLAEDLVYLAHVESSFNPYARSSAGAVGIWQFTRRGGKQFFKMGADLDQRRDPLMATAAAAVKLEGLYFHLGSWPLAITAYNVGRYGMERAARRVKSDDLATIISKYHHRNFGFSSTNFYCSFLAARQVASNPDRYFRSIDIDEPLCFRTQRTLSTLPIDSLARALSLNTDVLAALNPALSRTVRQNKRPVPCGYGLHIPVEINMDKKESTIYMSVQRALLAVAYKVNQWTQTHGTPVSVPLAIDTTMITSTLIWPHWSEQRYLVNDATIHICIHPEETIGHFAQWLDLPASYLRTLNGISRRHTIKAGQKLKLDFSRVNVRDFEKARISYHRAVWQTFFADQQISSWRDVVIGRGDSLWTLVHKNPDVPYWLLWAANEDLLSKKLSIGQVVTMPVIQQ
ncbi:transglycosylase SLT domain-containing protein [bacterium]|nr:transglycosylase SLT domain-containing protein [bacterium]